jgi:threonine aldolase
MLGHEAALFVPSGTMCNAIAIRLHIRPGGDEIILDDQAHPAQFEAAGPAALAGASLRPIMSAGGIFSADDLRAAIRGTSRYAPRSRLLLIEQPTYTGRVWDAEALRELVTIARDAGLRIHVDGARMMNAAVAASCSPARFAAQVDTIGVDLAKGLGCPVGALLAGSAELMEEAWRFKQMFGGAMRQTGYLAAAGLHALDHHVERLAEDHTNARALAEGLARVAGVTVVPDAIETNVVMFSVPDAQHFVARAARAGVDLLAHDRERVRAVTYLGIEREDIAEALHRLSRITTA